MKIAIVHPWYLANGGAEQVVNVLAEAYPTADFFTLFYREQDLPSNIKGRKITAHRWNWLPGKYKFYRHLLPLYPMLFESLNLTGYDLVITSDSCVIKGVLVDQNAVHVCYCHSPMRCLWDLYWEFRKGFPAIVRPIFTLGSHYVRQWDLHAASRVDAFMANSEYIAQRIRKYYRRDSTIIYPPVNTDKGYISEAHGDYYLSVGRLTNIKRIDLLIEACNRLQRRFIIAGAGRELKHLKSIAGPTIEFVGRVPDKQLGELYSKCRAFLFAADEDFGIVPVEAQSYGRPVVAYGRGGTRETVIPVGNVEGKSPTGVFFNEQTVESISDAMLRFEAAETQFVPMRIQQHAQQFDARLFARKVKTFVDQAVAEHGLLSTERPAQLELAAS